MRPKMMKRWMFVAAVCLMAGCGITGSTVESQASDATLAVSGTTTTTAGAVDELEMDLIESAVRDLSARLSVPGSEIELVSVENVTWPDGSLGCPEPDQMYTQALVEGHRIVLGHSGRVYVFHAGGDAPPFLCQSEDKDGGYDFVPPPGYGED